MVCMVSKGGREENERARWLRQVKGDWVSGECIGMVSVKKSMPSTAGKGVVVVGLSRLRGATAKDGADDVEISQAHSSTGE